MDCSTESPPSSRKKWRVAKPGLDGVCRLDDDAVRLILREEFRAIDAPQKTHREEDRLAIELQFYAAHKQEFLKRHSGEYVVIHGTTILGFFQSWEQAFRSGADAFGMREDFVVKQVLARDPIYFVG
jgi:hypothetical protein